MIVIAGNVCLRMTVNRIRVFIVSGRQKNCISTPYKEISAMNERIRNERHQRIHVGVIVSSRHLDTRTTGDGMPE